MKPISKWKREWFTREMPLEEGNPLTASFELYDSGVVGIHLYNCFEGNLLRTDALRIIVHFRSRTEYDETGKGIYILVRGEMPYFDGYQGLQIETYYLTGKTIVYEEIIENQEALEWFLREYSFFLRDLPDMYEDTKYYRQVTMEGDILKISVPNVKKGTRHKTLLSHGGRLLSEGYDMERVEIKMYDFNVMYCVPPLPRGEFEGIVESVKKYSKESESDGKL